MSTAPSTGRQTALAGVIAPRFGVIPGTEEGIQGGLKRTARVVGILDKHLAGHRFLAGEAMTAADLFLVPIFFYFPEIAELKALAEASPNCGCWARDMGARPSVKATDPQIQGTQPMTHKATWHGKTIAESDRTLEVGGYIYFPRETVRMDLLKVTPKTASDLECPHGVQFYDVVEGGTKSARAAWSYEAPQPKMKPVDHWIGFWEDVAIQ